MEILRLVGFISMAVIAVTFVIFAVTTRRARMDALQARKPEESFSRHGEWPHRTIRVMNNEKRPSVLRIKKKPQAEKTAGGGVAMLRSSCQSILCGVSQGDGWT